GSVEVLLTERAAHLKHHPGQISFPGGASEPDDRGLAETAIRETAEEVGIAVPAIDVIGYLRPQWTISSYAMTPVVALIQGPIAPVVDQQEVADAFLVPAERIFERRFQAVQRRSFEGMEFDAVEINWGEKRIWGATATVIQRVTKIIENNEI
ncbi:MAG: CoA pyrophosphatase, partial [Pseudomonadota bacterium]